MEFLNSGLQGVLGVLNEGLGGKGPGGPGKRSFLAECAAKGIVSQAIVSALAGQQYNKQEKDQKLPIVKG